MAQRFSAYDLQYVVFRLDIQKEHQLTDLQTKIISFIMTFLPTATNGEFYFSNKRLAEMFSVNPEKPLHETTISRAISALEKKGLVETTNESLPEGGTRRYIRLSIDATSEGVDLAQTLRRTTKRPRYANNNKNINNNVNVYYSNADQEVNSRHSDSEEFAKYLAEELQDHASLGYYRQLADSVNRDTLQYCLSLTSKTTGLDNPGAFFTSLVLKNISTKDPITDQNEMQKKYKKLRDEFMSIGGE